MKEGDDWKTAVGTQYRLPYSLVMLFEHPNAPPRFQNLIINALQLYVDRVNTAYLDDILICIDTLEARQVKPRQIR